MIRLTGFADEISKDLTEQLDVLESESMRFLELRGVWGKNVSTFTDDEVGQIRDALQARQMGVSCIGSPIGKIGINDPFAPHMETFSRVLDIAAALDTKYVRVFSFYIPEGEDPARYRDEVMARMRQMVELAADRNIMLLHENESNIYGDIATRCADILNSVNAPNLRAIFDPANFVQVGQRPYSDCWSHIQPYLEYMHIKDAILETRKVVPAGEGDGNLKEIVASLKAMNFSGFASLEPHLHKADRMYGFSGPELFKTAVQAFKRLLDDAGVAWS
jgi:3-dehydroshikimate dehydratase